MIIGIPISRNAYTPECYAYHKYLISKGHIVQFDYELDPNNDINLHIMGLKPFWEKKKGKAKEIHEYQSLSTPPYAKLKNFGKKIINNKPSGRIFLNNFVYEDMGFQDNVSYIYRDMGVDKYLFQAPNPHPNYDIIYCGSITGRKGLIEILLNLAKFYRVIVVGNVSEEEKLLLNHTNITLVGKVNREQLPQIYREARFGLNFTPDVYPYNIQTSTKTLEYLASGLGVISNRYKWSEVFFRRISYSPVWLSEDFEDLLNFDVVYYEGIKDFSWNKILDKCSFDDFIKELL